jgi:hypothetical protein
VEPRDILKVVEKRKITSCLESNTVFLQLVPWSPLPGRGGAATDYGVPAVWKGAGTRLCRACFCLSR